MSPVAPTTPGATPPRRCSPPSPARPSYAWASLRTVGWGSRRTTAASGRRPPNRPPRPPPPRPRPSPPIPLPSSRWPPGRAPHLRGPTPPRRPPPPRRPSSRPGRPRSPQPSRPTTAGPMAERSRRLAELAAAAPGGQLEGEGETLVSDVAFDSRAVVPGALFCCVPGQQVDGHAFAAEALRAGAVALLVQHRLDVDVPQLLVPDARASLGPVAAEFWGHPSQRLAVLGVTGTNGKTTVTHLLRDLFLTAGRRTEVLGTLSGSRTTPEAPELQARLAAWVAEDVEVVAMEVSSHALDLRRVDATRFTTAVFTNLGHDHLDHHGTMAAYFQAKARLFEPAMADRAVVDLDDPHGRLLADAAQVPTTGYSLDDAEVVERGPAGTTFRWRGRELHVHLAGRHNLSNALAAATVGADLGLGLDDVAAGLAAARPVPGRFEAVEAGQPFAVVVDYAHTPDALAAALDAAREVVAGAGGGGRVHVVFGCGGDRDPAKRAPMGEVAARLADRVVLTSDNPRWEDAAAIIDQIREGASRGGGPAGPGGADVAVEPDRRAAIALAIESAVPGDVVVVAGKGHERAQTIRGVEHPFDDRAVARELLGALGTGRGR
ncbi:MAG: UDP-N-acetylmuramoyl-L-alanyl-D-glutamate--2,6-diaminopimelate ligase [Acidimicrobiia bacterium]|nr:UDP-N-acetylmuramoyl-L-alanyl-D-glutamate--2,6-diaminopimelate ligase [Acidimicrobiia bacterium]